MLSKQLSFDKLHNIRDLGGMSAADGKLIADNCFLRSGHLEYLSEKDEEKLKDSVGMIIDFRTDSERAEKPDLVLDNISYIHLPVIEDLTAGITREAEADRNLFATLGQKPIEAKKYMCDMYRSFAGDGATRRYSEFVRLLLKKRDKAILWHCTAGKDRAGIAAAIVEEILGVSREDVIADYLSTNKYIEKDIEFLTDFVKKQTGTDSGISDEALRYLFAAHEDYIGCYYEAVLEKYSDFENYLSEGLKLTKQDITGMRSIYLINS
ncbi:MAG: tyrosine-protein phosphatase [Lachnospiraceae bacterium]|nr:tyrosine-protein phosphatase [Lachnospiraceae bacterium]